MLLRNSILSAKMGLKALFCVAVLVLSCDVTTAKFPDWLVTQIDWPVRVFKSSGNLVKPQSLNTYLFNV